MPGTIPEIAARVIAEIRAIQPNGPYHVGGFCTPGILAYEVASQLRADGAEVAVLVLIESINPVPYLELNRLRLTLSKARFRARKLLTGTEDTGAGLAGMIGRAIRMAVLPDGRQQPLWNDVVGDALDQAAYAYRPPAYDGDVLLFQAVDRVGILDTRPGWRPLIGARLQAHEIAGGHMSILRSPYVEAFGARLEAAIASIDFQSPAPDASAMMPGGARARR